MSSSSAPANAHPDTPLLPAFMHATTIWNLIKTPDGLAKNPHLCWLLLVSTFTEDIKRLGSPDNEKSWMDSHADHEELASAIIGDLAYCPASFPGDHNLTLKMRMLWAGKDLERLAKSLFKGEVVSDPGHNSASAIPLNKPENAAIITFCEASNAAAYPFLAQEPEGVPLGSLGLVDDLKEDPQFAKMEGDRNALMKDSGKNADSIEKLEDKMNEFATVYPYLPLEVYAGVPLEELFHKLENDEAVRKLNLERTVFMRDPAKNAAALDKLEDGISKKACEFAKELGISLVRRLKDLPRKDMSADEIKEREVEIKRLDDAMQELEAVSNVLSNIVELKSDPVKNADEIKKLENARARELAKKKSPTVDYPFLDKEPEGMPLASLMDALHDDPEFYKDDARRKELMADQTKNADSIKNLEDKMNAKLSLEAHQKFAMELKNEIDKVFAQDIPLLAFRDLPVPVD